jgi:hypothetical protein
VRRVLFWAIAVFTLATVQSFALQTHPHVRFPGFGHARKVEAPPKIEQDTANTDTSSLGSPLVLDKGWRVGITADPAAADPAFDDSHWAVRNGKGTIADVTEPSDDPDHSDRPDRDDKYAWFRMNLKLAPNHGPIALLIELPVTQSASMNFTNAGPGADVYANGKLILPEGPHPGDSFKYQQISRLYDLNIPASETSLTLAIRTLYIPFGLKGYTNFFYNRTFSLGDREDLDRSLELWSVRTLFERLPRLVVAILLLFLSVFLVTLYFTQKGNP